MQRANLQVVHQRSLSGVPDWPFGCPFAWARRLASPHHLPLQLLVTLLFVPLPLLPRLFLRALGCCPASTPGLVGRLVLHHCQLEQHCRSAHHSAFQFYFTQTTTLASVECSIFHIAVPQCPACPLTTDNCKADHSTPQFGDLLYNSKSLMSMPDLLHSS